jgi:hypothetical protein
MAKLTTRQVLLVVVGLVVIGLVITVIMSSRKSSDKKKREVAARSRGGGSSARVNNNRARAGAMNGEASMNGASMNGAAAGGSCRSGGSCGNMAAYYDGQTANSDHQPNATMTREILQTATEGDMRQGTLNAKFLTTAQMGLSSGGLFNFSDETINEVLTTGNVNVLIAEAAAQDPDLTRRILEASSQRADSTGISRGKMLSHDEKRSLVAVETGLDVTSLGGKDSSRSGRPQDFAALARAVGAQNMQYYTESKRQFDNVIDEALVSTADTEKVAALLAIINNESDPVKKEKLLIGLKGLRTAMFSSAEKAREALTNVPDLGFQYQKPARGEVGTLGARYGAQGTRGGPGGDLMPVFFPDDVIPTVNKERLAACGGATTQAYAYAMGDKAVLDM